MTRAKTFTNGRIQAVRLPKSGRVPAVQATDAWSEEFLATLGAWKEKIERPSQQPIVKSNDPFAGR